ncbi:hypothetical protein D3P08_17170 [Paenibacillus nanensis]|uniref:Uncharacterized protein n=1 Tax=Paenibacillus nanensis TaxID=393251 RepID=A0A3A1URT0_9BACL|nr:hypothetical protein [Paenibacillus nanensis]RIX51207.1 hypothetical protein D3P08_17170 [Paenibacillus nanensis]
MRNTFVIFLLILILMSACSKEKEFVPETYYHYSGEMISLINQHGNEYAEKDGILYTLMLLKFRPQEPGFEKFLEQYSQHPGKEGHVVLTKRTKIYEQDNDSSKTTIPISTLMAAVKPVFSEDYPDIEMWVAPFKANPYDVEAIEVILKR